MEAQDVEDDVQLEKEETPTMYKIGKFALQNRITQSISTVAKTTIAVAQAIPDVAIKGAAVNRYNQKQEENQRRAAELLDKVREEKAKEAEQE